MLETIKNEVEKAVKLAGISAVVGVTPKHILIYSIKTIQGATKLWNIFKKQGMQVSMISNDNLLEMPEFTGYSFSINI